VLFEKTDKVKGFHGAVLHADVLGEREAQIHFNRTISELERKRELTFLKQRSELLNQADNAEIEKLKAAKASALEQKDAQMQQLEDLKACILAEREQMRMEVCIPSIGLQQLLIECRVVASLHSCKVELGAVHFCHLGQIA
jgi:hypothetical protein